jgi:hypothetical protein
LLNLEREMADLAATELFKSDAERTYRANRASVSQ